MSTAVRTVSRTDQVVSVLEQHRFDDMVLVAWMSEEQQ